MITKILYNILFSLFALCYLPVFFIKGKAKGGVGSRFGNVPADVRARLQGHKVIWVHAVSVGEVALAVRLLNHWRAVFASYRFVLTTTTIAGYEVAQKTKHPSDELLQFPVDFGFSVKRFTDAVRPAAVVMMETEIWPNLVWQMAKNNTPVIILNGRISDKALKKYRWVRFFLKPVLRLFSGIGAQDETMCRRFIELGAHAENVQTTGNLKYDWQPPESMAADTLTARQRLSGSCSFLLIAASTHAGEEEILMDIYKKIRSRVPGFGLLLAPRHLDRLGEVETLARKNGTPLKRVFTRVQNGYDNTPEGLWLLDRMGVLAHLYPAASAVFIGGSLVRVGGHNPVEPAYFEKPVLFGPHMNNFLEMSRLFIEKKAAISVRDAGELEECLEYLTRNNPAAIQMGREAKDLVQSRCGAFERNSRLVERFLPKA